MSETDCMQPLRNPRAGSNCIWIHSNHSGFWSPFNWRLGWAFSLDPAPVHRSQPRPPFYDFKGLAGGGPALRHGTRLRQEKSHIPDWLEDRPTNNAMREHSRPKMWFKMMWSSWCFHQFLWNAVTSSELGENCCHCIRIIIKITEKVLVIWLH